MSDEIDMAVSMSGECWSPTQDLRWIKSKPSSPGKRLQQRWVCIITNRYGHAEWPKEEWRDVPTVDD